MVATVLTTPRLLLRPLEPDDLDALTALGAEESYWWYGLRRAMTPEETAGFLARVRSGYQSESPSLLGVVERSTGSLAGYAGLSVPSFLPEVLPAVEVGWRLGEAFRGRGYATEAGAASLRWGFNELGLQEILSIFEPENVASGRVMDHLGFGPGTPTVHPRLGVALLVRRLTAAAWRATSESPGVPPGT